MFGRKILLVIVSVCIVSSLLSAQLYSAQEQINTYIGKSAAAANRLDRTQEEMLDIQVDLKGMLSRYEDVDLAEAITMMSQQEQALQAAMSVTGRISKLSILDYL